MQGAALVEQQHGIVSIDQLAQLGLTKDQVRHRVRRGSWRRVYPRVFATQAGDLDFQARVWAAVLAAGPTAMASHATAGRLQGLVDEDPDQIELTVGLSSSGHDRPGVR